MPRKIKPRDDEARERTLVKFCPSCGRRPEDGVNKEGRHVFTLRCEKCRAGFVVHVNG